MGPGSVRKIIRKARQFFKLSYYPWAAIAVGPGSVTPLTPLSSALPSKYQWQFHDEVPIHHLPYSICILLAASEDQSSIIHINN